LKWISIKDEIKPHRGQWILVAQPDDQGLCGENFIYHMAIYFGCNGIDHHFYAMGSDIEYKDTTHWMSLYDISEPKSEDQDRMNKEVLLTKMMPSGNGYVWNGNAWELCYVPPLNRAFTEEEKIQIERDIEYLSLLRIRI
jgi:hypothetical protein